VTEEKSNSGQVESRGPAADAPPRFQSDQVLPLSHNVVPPSAQRYWIGVLAVVCAVGIFGYWLGSQDENEPEGGAVRGDGLSAEHSRLTTVSMAGRWVESDMLVDDSQQWTGSGVIIDEDADDLIIMTNSHCIALPSIVSGQPETPDIKSYEFAVVFAGSNQPRRVTRFAETQAGGLDLALLRVARGDLRRGTDYEIAPIAKRSFATQGQETVAIGAPLGLRNTETYGRVSAIRSAVEMGGFSVLQTDAAVNPGNSGGPLFVVVDGRRFLVAITTFGFSGAENLNFAYFADEYGARNWEWFDANPAGVVKALRQIYNFEAVEVR